MITRMAGVYHELSKRHPRIAKIGRFGVAGGTASAVNLATLFVFTEFFHLWYLASGVFAYILAFFVSFVLQKFWTFQDHSRDRVGLQAGGYFLFGIWNLVLNTIALFVLVETFSLHYLLAQVFVSVFIAVENFLVYHYFFFKRRV